MKKAPVEYRLVFTSFDEYELYLLIKEIKNNLMMKIFNKATIKFKRMGTDINGNPNYIKKFKVEPRYYNFLSIQLTKQLNQLKSIQAQQGRNIINHKVVEAWFIKEDNGNWIVDIKITGLYCKLI